MNYRNEALKILMKGRIWTNTANNEIIIHDNGNKPTETEIQEKIEEVIAAEPMMMLRDERDKLLAEPDWRATIDYQGTKQSEWLTYRQALRDLPANTADANNPTWPTPPEGD